MGFFHEHFVAVFEGIEIEVETNMDMQKIGSKTRLVIDNQKIDEGECSLFGTIILRGDLEMKSSKKHVLLQVKQGLLKTHYSLKISGQEQKLEKR